MSCSSLLKIHIFMDYKTQSTAHTSRNGQKSQITFKCLGPRHIPKVRVFDADFRKVTIKLVDCPVSEIPTHNVLGYK